MCNGHHRGPIAKGLCINTQQDSIVKDRHPVINELLQHTGFQERRPKWTLQQLNTIQLQNITAIGPK